MPRGTQHRFIDYVPTARNGGEGFFRGRGHREMAQRADQTIRS